MASRFACAFFLAFFFVPRWTDALGCLPSVFPEAACPSGRWLRPPPDQRRTWWQCPSIRSPWWESCVLVCSPGLGEECPDDVRVGDVGQLGALLGKPLDVLSQGFPWLLAAAPKIPRVPRAHIRTLEISSEALDQVVPVGDLRRRQMLQPCSGSVGEKKGEVADDEVVTVPPSQLARQPVIRKPQLRPCLP
jgi:hypothetical protein